MRASMLWRVSRPIRTRYKPPGFVLPCQPALADRLPAGHGWQHEIKWDGYRIIARKEGVQVSLWARTGTDYTAYLDRIRAAIAALPIGAAVLDGEAVTFDREGQADFAGLRTSAGQTNDILIAYDLLEVDGQDIRRSPLQDRRKRLERLLRQPKGKAAQKH